MKLGPPTKIDQKKNIKSKNFDDDIMLTNFDVIVIFPKYGQFGTIWILED